MAEGCERDKHTLDADWNSPCQHSRLSQSNNCHNWKENPIPINGARMRVWEAGVRMRP